MIDKPEIKKVWVDHAHGHVDAHEAVKLITREWVESDNSCQETTITLRDALLDALHLLEPPQASEEEMPQEIQQLIAQCEANVSRFTNDQMSAALHFAELLWRERAVSRKLTPEPSQPEVIGDEAKECKARGEILDRIQAATGSTWWIGAADWADRVFAACVKADSTEDYKSNLTRELVPAYIGQLAKERDHANRMSNAAADLGEKHVADLRTYIGKIGSVLRGGMEAEGQGQELDAAIAVMAGRVIH